MIYPAPLRKYTRQFPKRLSSYFLLERIMNLRIVKSGAKRNVSKEVLQSTPTMFLMAVLTCHKWNTIKAMSDIHIRPSPPSNRLHPIDCVIYCFSPRGGGWGGGGGGARASGSGCSITRQPPYKTMSACLNNFISINEFEYILTFFCWSGGITQNGSRCQLFHVLH